VSVSLIFECSRLGVICWVESLLERWFGAASSHGQALRQHISETAILRRFVPVSTAALQAQLPQRLGSPTLLTSPTW